MTLLLLLALGQSLSNATPLPVESSGSSGTSSQGARADHQHVGLRRLYKVGSNPNTGSSGDVGLEPGAACTLTPGTDATYSKPKFTFNCTASGGTSHNLLSVTHTDTTGAGSEARGDLIVRNNATQWTSLHIGATGTVLHGGTDPSWSRLLTSELSGTIAVTQGGTGQTSWSDDTLLVGDGTNPQPKTLPSCTGKGKGLTYDPTTNTFGCNPTPSLPARATGLPLRRCNALITQNCR